MLKIIFSLGLVSTLSFNLYGEACGKFKPTITKAEDFYKEKTIVDMAVADYNELKKIYTCVLDKSKKISAAAEIKKEEYEEVVKEAVLLENNCLNYDNVLRKCVKLINSNAQLFTAADKIRDRQAALYKTGVAVLTIGSYARDIAGGMYLIIEKDFPSLKDKIAEWKKDEVIDNKLSLLYLLDSINTTKKENEDVTSKLGAALKGDINSADFKNKLKENKYDVKTIEQSVEKEIPVDQKTKDKDPVEEDKKTPDKTVEAALLAQLLANLTNNNNNNNGNANNNNNATTAPVLTSDKGKGGGGGGAGSLAGASAGSRGGFDDDDRKELLARAKARDNALMRRDMQRDLFGSGSSSKSLKSPTLGREGSGSSLRDLFSKRFDDSDKIPVNKKSDVPSIFGGGSDEDVKQDDEKYKNYFKGGANPSAAMSSKDMALNRFSNMYETARLNALTEGADQEFAGRYIDLFLLVHTILDHQYRDKGKLIDTTELIPSPLGPTPYKQRP